MKLDIKQDKLLKKLADKYNVTLEEAVEIIQSPFSFIRATLKNIKLEGDETEEQFEEKTKNFNIPYIGKIYANYNTFKKINNGRKRRIKKRENNKGDESL